MRRVGSKIGALAVKPRVHRFYAPHEANPFEKDSATAPRSLGCNLVTALIEGECNTYHES